MEAPARIELAHKGFADLSLTTWVRRRKTKEKSGRRGSNSRPQLWESCILPLNYSRIISYYSRAGLLCQGLDFASFASLTCFFRRVWYKLKAIDENGGTDNEQNRNCGGGAAAGAAGGDCQAQLGGTSTTEDEQNMTAGAATHGTTTVFQEQLKTAYADFNAERYPKATQELQVIIKKDPGNLPAHQMLAAVYQKQNQIADMVPELETIVRLDPKDKNSQHNLGVAYLQTGRFDKAAATFKTLQARSPKDPQVAYYSAWRCCRRENWTRRFRRCKTPIKLQPTAPEYLELGVALEQQGKQDEAAAAFQSAADLDPKDPQAALYAGMLYHQTGHDDKAIPALKKALDLGTDNKFGAHMMLAEAYDKAGQKRRRPPGIHAGLEPPSRTISAPLRRSAF